jgi:hypothetical protein
MKFNINEDVRVRLTDYGRTVHRQNHDNLFAQLPARARIAYKPLIEDDYGWSRWQLWVLMSEFGPHMSIGSENCFDTTIELPGITSPQVSCVDGTRDARFLLA